MNPSPMKLSVVVPAHNEEAVIGETVRDIVATLNAAGIPHEVILVNDNSTDGTADIAIRLMAELPTVRVIHRQPPSGFGRAIRDGLANITGDCVVIAMGDASDDPNDIVTYYRKLAEGYDCVFGTRFTRGTIVRAYPLHKLIVNRIANTFIQVLFGTRYNDMTNAFKGFRAEVIRDISPLLANHFNMTVELPLKAMNRGYRFAVVPVNWYGRTAGVSRLSIRTMGRKYLFTVLHLWLERHLMRDELAHPAPAPLPEAPKP
ncbi:MAG: glycosyltransferase family 2 protein [Chloroflexota bacterium]|nr:glycosyltransferase family 2 protein [Dehalococcoidia bacterium]MDW8252388.1 glycosyltransferase family 2 protein [Chloroflexota bacterium]